MKSYYLLFLFASTLVQCQQKRQPQPNEGSVDLLKMDPSLKAYKDSLAWYFYKPERNLWALDLFKLHFDKTRPDQCDLALKSFLTYQDALVDTLNSALYKRHDYDAINTIIYSDTNLRKKEGLDFEKYMNENGLVIKATEGAIYIDRDSEIIRSYFYDFLTTSTKEFLEQFIQEERQELSEDGALIIPIEDLANRLAFWDQFYSKYPQHIFSDFAANHKKMYLYFLLAGMDNTPSFEFESKKINKNFLDAYLIMATKHHDISSSKVIADFVELLKKNDYRGTDQVNQFIAKYSIY